MSDDDIVVKPTGVASEESATSRMNLSQVGYTGLKEVSGYIFEDAKVELRYPYAGETYRKMMLDPTIASVTNFIKLMITKAEWAASYPEDASEEVKEAAEFLGYCMSNMVDQTWREFISQVVDYIFYGFQINEKVYTRVTSGEWAGKIKWKHLPSRPQDTLTGWGISKDGLVQYVKQNPSRLGVSAPEGEVKIPRKKFLHFKHHPRSSNPEGTAGLRGCYLPWKEKTLANELELVGLTKDLAGIVNIGVDAEYLAKAALNPAGPEARNIEQMKKDAANLSAGSQSFVITPIAYSESGKDLFNFELTGVQGSGKQFSTDTVIRRKQNEMLTVFLADVLKIGQDSAGSYALSDSKNNILALALEGYLKTISDVINRDLVPQTLAMNGWKFSAEEMPKITFGDIEDRDLDVLSKYLQRVAATGLIFKDKKLDAAIRKAANLPEADYDDPMPEQDSGDSRSGSGLSEGMPNGTGDSDGDSGDDSIDNAENA
ncbi:MAG: putative portal protein [Prokaryotic dsDNA virus sp.]|nr:MAG: putative portal protein [Prokaryotic dsDNA virus sp.]|tara:strand:- start:56714 stop:58174 length:1461 start_codon:yes stop_codon:yes gene_type:complete